MSAAVCAVFDTAIDFIAQIRYFTTRQVIICQPRVSFCLETRQISLKLSLSFYPLRFCAHSPKITDVRDCQADNPREHFFPCKTVIVFIATVNAPSLFLCIANLQFNRAVHFAPPSACAAASACPAGVSGMGASGTTYAATFCSKLASFLYIMSHCLSDNASSSSPSLSQPMLRR